MNLASRYNAIPGISLGTKIFLHLRWWLTPYARMAAYVPKTAKVLDVGCGHGLLAMELAPDGRAEKNQTHYCQG